MISTPRFSLAGRLFTVAALLSLAAVSGSQPLRAALFLVPLAGLAQLLTWRLDATVVALLEATTAAAIAVLSWPGSEEVTLPYLVVPVLMAAVGRGRSGLLLGLGTEVAALSASWLATVHRFDQMMLAGSITWIVAAAGIGLLGTVFRRVAGSEHDAAYREATQLIRQLSAITGRLGERLDITEAADHVLAQAEEHLPTTASVVFIRDVTSAQPRLLRCSQDASPDLLAQAEPLSAQCLATGDVRRDGATIALPLPVGPETIGTLVVQCVRPASEQQVRQAGETLRGAALRLQAAQLFGDVRDSATAGERQRISREMHDGVAQDVASLGYLVDEIGMGATDPAQQQLIRTLREELTHVIAQLRRSVFELRHDQPAGQGLGESLSASAQHVASVSPVRVHVTLDERGPRLPREVEQQLLRIGQEAMTNVRKHAGADNLWLDCTVRAPTARIEVRDDGSRPHAPSSDSQGVSIMRERAESIGARLTVESPQMDRPGTRVVVVMPAPITSLGAGERELR